jgi:hypothetical protein
VIKKGVERKGRKQTKGKNEGKKERKRGKS